MAALWAGPVWAATVTAVRIGDHPDKTRLVIDLSMPVDHKAFALADPNRIVIDLPPVEWALPHDAGTKAAGAIQQYRYGLFQPGKSRIVFDLSRPVLVEKIFSLPPGEGMPHRLVIDLKTTDQDNFRRQAGWPDEAGLTIGNVIETLPPVDNEPPTETVERKRIVVIDPGHGGVDPGAPGAQSHEKDVVLAFAKTFRDRLQATGNYDVYMTRDTDIFIPLHRRVQIARKHHADLFISIHANSIARPEVNGASVYTLSETASDREAEALAQKENRADIIAGLDLGGESTDVTNILIDLAQRETKNYSARFARLVIPEMGNKTKLLKNTHRFAGFAVLKAPDVPSVLVEIGYMTNRAEEQLMNSSAWRNDVAQCMVSAVNGYFSQRMAEGPQ
jgi:N-acetylmuramoyl-L-alanine amidase